MSKQAILLVNLGTPDAPTTPAVRRYLREFLSDPRVIDIPAPLRFALLNLVILPFRPSKSAAAYRQVWMDRGSPLLVHGQGLASKLDDKLTQPVFLAMRYGQPSIKNVMQELGSQGIQEITVLPLFPQFSDSAWAAAVDMIYRQANLLTNLPAIRVLPPFYEHPGFLAAMADIARPVLTEMQPDKLLMSFHGLPERHMHKSDLSQNHGLQSHCLTKADCCQKVGQVNAYCYRAHCYATARGLAKLLQLKDRQYEVAFQSRLGRTPWIQPFTDVRVQELVGEGCKRLAVICPSFVADCLETLEEIGIRARRDFLAAGGEDLQLIPCVNSSDAWVTAVADMVRGPVPS